jgi:hypothetical protein
MRLCRHFFLKKICVFFTLEKPDYRNFFWRESSRAKKIPARKPKSGFFFGPKNFTGPGDPDFLYKNRNCRKNHDEAK